MAKKTSPQRRKNVTIKQEKENSPAKKAESKEFQNWGRAWLVYLKCFFEDNLLA